MKKILEGYRFYEAFKNFEIAEAILGDFLELGQDVVMIIDLKEVKPYAIYRKEI